MNVTEIPFNAFLKIEKSLPNSSHLLQLPDSPSYLNHLGTVHASVQISLAEASSGELLLQALPELSGKALAVVRRLDAKFKKPMQGVIFSRATSSIEEIRHSAEALTAKGRLFIPVSVEIVDAEGNVGLVATVEWFITVSIPKEKP